MIIISVIKTYIADSFVDSGFGISPLFPAVRRTFAVVLAASWSM